MAKKFFDNCGGLTKMFSLVRKLFGIERPEEFAKNGALFYGHLEKLDDPNLNASRIRELLGDESLGRLLRQAQRFPWRTDDQEVANWKSVAQGAFYGTNYWLEYRADSVGPCYLVFDVLRNLSVSPADFCLSVTGFAEKERVGKDQETYNHFMVHQPAGDGYALIFRITNAVPVEGVLHIGTCRVFIGKRRLEALSGTKK
jgi:hypothetical protein